MSKKKPKYATGQPFPINVCDAIRTHIGTRKALESQRVNAFGDRDAALAELEELSDKHCPEALKLKERHSDAIVAIDSLSKRIGWHNKQIDELVENADSPPLDFMLEPPPDVTAPRRPKPASEKSQLKLAGGEEGEGAGGTAADARPVGRRKGGAGSGDEAPSAHVYEGVDEHLNASVNDLDLPENRKGKLIDAGLFKIGQVAAVIDKGSPDLRDVLNCGEGIASEIRRAVGAFRKQHRKAAREVEAAS